MQYEPTTTKEQEDFSFVLGGPLYQLFLHTRLVRQPLDLLHRRIIASLLVTWLPLAVLTALSGTFVSNVSVPFLFDLTNVRFLITLPLLMVAEVIVHRRMRPILGEFLERELVASGDQPRFESIVALVLRLRNSVVVELLLLLIAFTGGYWLWREYGTLQINTWYASAANGVIEFSAAGYWLAFVSLPIVRFVVLRWYFRLSLWYLFLWRVSRLPLRLNPLHPDRAGGLGFLEHSISAFSPVLVAQSIFLAAVIGSQILYAGRKLTAFQMEIGAFVAILAMLVLTPLMFFVFQMLEAKLAALREYGQMANSYARTFREKWLRREEISRDELLGTGDIQSLADLANAFEVIRSMRLVPFDRHTVIRLAILIALPMAPLVLTLIPLDELVQRLVKLLV